MATFLCHHSLNSVHFPIGFQQNICILQPSTNNAVLEQAVSYMKHLKQQSALFFANNGSQAQCKFLHIQPNQ